MQITEHFSLEEMTKSHALDVYRRTTDTLENNLPTQTVMNNLRSLCNTLEYIRRGIGNHPIHINSGYRSPMVNKLVGGSAGSLHKQGRAADLSFNDPHDFWLAFFIASTHPNVTECYLSYKSGGSRWLHVGIALPGNETPTMKIGVDIDGRIFNDWCEKGFSGLKIFADF